MFFYSQISCKVIGKVLYNSTFKGRENGPKSPPLWFFFDGGPFQKTLLKILKNITIVDPSPL